MITPNPIIIDKYRSAEVFGNSSPRFHPSFEVSDGFVISHDANPAMPIAENRIIFVNEIDRDLLFLTFSEISFGKIIIPDFAE